MGNQASSTSSGQAKEAYTYSNVTDASAEDASQVEREALSPKSSTSGAAQGAGGATPNASQNSARSADRTLRRDAGPKATPATFTKVKLWQLVLFSTCLFLMFACTIMVLISYCGGYLGYAPVSSKDRRPKRSPKVVIPDHPWSMHGVTFDCTTTRWRDTQEWSDIKLDFCCENAAIGCARVPGYACDTDAPSQPIFVVKRWCCFQEGVFCPQLDESLQEQSKRGLPQCANPESCRDFNCEMGKEKWWLDWSVPKMQWCCHEAYNCGAAGVPVTPKVLHVAPRGAASHHPDADSGCLERCTMGSDERSCIDWVFFLADNTFKQTTTPCELGLQRAHERCPSCSKCTAASACSTPEAQV